MSTSPRKICVFLNQPTYYDGHVYSTDYPYLTDFVATFAEDFEEVHACVLLKRSTSIRGANVLSLPKNMKLVGLPFYEGEDSFVQRLPLTIPAAWRVARREARECDVVGFMSPTTIGCLFALNARSRYQFELIRGDNRECVSAIYGRGLRRVAYGAGLEMIESLARFLRRRNRPVTFAFGKHLQERYEADNPGRVFELSDGLSTEFLQIPSGRSTNEPQRDGEFRVLCVGRLSREKGAIYLLEAFANLIANGKTNFRLRVVGSGPTEDELRHYAQERGLDQRVEFTGFVARGPELVREYDQADVLVLPSLTEGFPRVVPEAMARGAAIIASNVGGVPELIAHETTGLLVDPGNSYQIQQALMRLYQDPGLRSRLAQNASQKASRYALAAQHDRMLGILKETFDW